MEEKTFEVQKVTNLDVAFGCRAMDLMPPYADIPDTFKHGSTKWNKLMNDWFFCGLSKLDITPKNGINITKAKAHLKAILSSFEPPHEHKEAGVAFLMDQWFDDATWEKAKK